MRRAAVRGWATQCAMPLPTMSRWRRRRGSRCLHSNFGCRCLLGGNRGCFGSRWGRNRCRLDWLGSRSSHNRCCVNSTLAAGAGASVIVTAGVAGATGCFTTTATAGGATATAGRCATTAPAGALATTGWLAGVWQCWRNGGRTTMGGAERGWGTILRGSGLVAPWWRRDGDNRRRWTRRSLGGLRGRTR